MDVQPRRITLELDPGGPPISGHLYAEHEPNRPFTGWMGLLAALETVIEGKEPIRQGGERA